MPQDEIDIDRKKTAMVLIDLQKGIVARETKPYPSTTVVSNSAKLAGKCRELEIPVFLVHVNFTPETALKVKSDTSFGGAGDLPPDWADFTPEIGPEEGDIIVSKKQWGAFYGTDLELQLRRRGIDTIILGGIATTYGVESTARFAYEYGFQQIFAEDAMADMVEEAHRNAVEFVLKRMGRVRKTESILTNL